MSFCLKNRHFVYLLSFFDRRHKDCLFSSRSETEQTMFQSTNPEGLEQSLAIGKTDY